MRLLQEQSAEAQRALEPAIRQLQEQSRQIAPVIQQTMRQLQQAHGLTIESAAKTIQDRQQDTKTISVYVREGESDKVRTVAFRPPDEIAQATLLERGYALDGNSAVAAITADEDGTLMDNLLFAQRDLVKWLGEQGYRVVFK